MSDKSISSILDSINKKHGLKVGSLSDIAEDVRGLTTGNISIDHIIGVGGFPEGRSVEVYGVPSSGKTTTALQTAAALQKRIKAENSDEYILYMDYEHTIDKSYASALGLDMEHKSFMFTQPETLEQGSAVAMELIRSGKVRLIIWDSVAGMIPRDMLEGDTSTSAPVALQARLLSQLTSKLNSLLHDNNCTSIFINHVKDDLSIGKPGITKKITPGGKSLKFYSSVRLEFSPAGSKKGKRFNPLTNSDEEFTISSDVLVKVVKNKVAAPFRQCTVRVRYGQGFDNFWSALQILLSHRAIMPSNTGYYFFDKDKDLMHVDMNLNNTGRPFIRGEDSLMEFANTHPEWAELAIQKAQTILKSTEAVVHSSSLETGEEDD